MTIEEVHYEFKKKFNKVDSNQNRNLLIPEIDGFINEAVNLFSDIVARPRHNLQTGFEKNLKSIDDIRTLVVNDQGSLLSTIDENRSLVILPEDYRYFIRGRVVISKDGCKDRKAVFYLQEHDDEAEESPFNKSSFLWREVNGLFTEKGIILYSDGTFQHKDFLLSYIRKPKRAHFAKGFQNGSYYTPSGELLEGKEEIDLPEHTHREIVDLAVMLASGDIQAQDYQIKQSMAMLNNLK